MTKREAQRQLAENLILLAETLLDDETAGEYKCMDKQGELRITSVLGNSTTLVAIKNWNFEQLEDDWDEFIYEE